MGTEMNGFTLLQHAGEVTQRGSGTRGICALIKCKKGTDAINIGALLQISDVISVTPVHTVFDQIVDDRGICQCGGVAQGSKIVFGDLAQDATHDLAGAGFRQARGPLDDIW